MERRWDWGFGLDEAGISSMLPMLHSEVLDFVSHLLKLLVQLEYVRF